MLVFLYFCIKLQKIHATIAIMFNNHGQVIKNELDADILTDLCLNEIVFVCDYCLNKTQNTYNIGNLTYQSKSTYISKSRDNICTVAGESKQIKKNNVTCFTKHINLLYDQENQTKKIQISPQSLPNNNNCIQSNAKKPRSIENTILPHCKELENKNICIIDDKDQQNQKKIDFEIYKQNIISAENKNLCFGEPQKCNVLNTAYNDEINYQSKQSNVNNNKFFDKIDALSFFESIKMKNAKKFCIFCKSANENKTNINYPNQELSLQISYVNRFFVLYSDRNYFIIKFYQINYNRTGHNFF